MQHCKRTLCEDGEGVAGDMCPRSAGMLASSAEYLLSQGKRTVLGEPGELRAICPITWQVLLRSENILTRLFRFQSGAGSMLSKPKNPFFWGPAGASGRKNFMILHMHRPGLLHQRAQSQNPHTKICYLEGKQFLLVALLI